MANELDIEGKMDVAQATILIGCRMGRVKGEGRVIWLDEVGEQI